MEKYSEIYDIPKSLIFAIIYVESSFDRMASSSKGAIGLMQIMPSTAVFVDNSISDKNIRLYLEDAENNIRIGTKYLRYLLNKYLNDIILTLASYNAGEGNVDSWLSDLRSNNGGNMRKFMVDDIKFHETRKYIKKVLDVQNTYEKYHNL